MGRLSTLTILLTLGAGGLATEGARAEVPASPAGATTRPQPPVPPSEYVKAGIKLYNTGNMPQAATYFKAANDYRDMLAANDQASLDSYLSRMSAPTDTAVTPASAEVAPASVAPSAATVTSPPAGPRGGTTDAKQQARWYLQSAREQGRLGHYDEAETLVAQADALNIKWGLFDDTPAKVREAIDKVRPKLAPGSAAPAAPTATGHDRSSARARLKEGRNALNTGEFEQAEAIALEVNSWGLAYGMFEDTPAKLAAAARALRRRDVTRNSGSKAAGSQSVYDTLVNEARTLMARGQLDAAEVKARSAQRLNVVPPLTSDRAESVLHDIEVAKAAGPKAAPVVTAAPAVVMPRIDKDGNDTNQTTANEPASVVADREANALLAKNQTTAAMAKFSEAEQLRAREMKAAGVVDPAVRQVADASPAPAPAPAPALVAPMPAPAAVEPLPIPEAPAPVAATPPIPDTPVALDAAVPAAPMPAGSRGEELLAQAKTLFAQGNYPAAKAMANDAKTGKLGVDAQADELLSAIALSEQGGALSVYEAALDAIRKGDTARARALLTEVQASGASLDDGMKKKVQDLLDKLPKDDKAPAGRAIAADTLNDVQSIEAQRMNAEVGSKVAEARRWMETDPDKAIALLQEALAAVKAKDLPATTARPMIRRLEVGIELAKKDKAAFDVKMQDKAVRTEIETKKLRILEADKAKKAQIKFLMDQAEAAYANGKLAECETFAARAQEIDPNEIAPGLLRYKANLERHYKTDVANKREKEEGVLTAFQDVDKTAIIDGKALTNGISFAKGFPDLTRERMATNARLADRKPVATMAIEKKLNEPVSLNMKNQSLDEAVTFLQNYTGLNIILDTKALVDEGLTRDSKVDITVNSMKLKNVLKLMLRPLGLTYKVDEEALVITSPQAGKDSTYTKTYLVADLVIGPNRNPIDNPMTPGLMTPGTGNDVNAVQNAATAATLSGNLMSSTGGMTSGTGPRPKVDMMPLVQLITTSIAPGTWRVHDGLGGQSSDEGSYGMGGGFGGDAGGLGGTQTPIGSITPFFLSISLIIRHTAEIHEDIGDLLRQLRRLQDLQVSIEVRFINVTDDFFEQIGVDFDFNIQSDVVGRKSTFAVPNPAAALFPSNTFGGNTAGGVGGGGVGGGGVGGGGIGGGGGGIGGGGIGGGGGGIGGGSGGGGGGGGITGGGIGGGGNIGGGGGGIGGGGQGGGGGGTSGTQAPVFLVNPNRDHAIPSRGPLVVGTAGTGIANFTPNLGIPFTQTSAANITTFNNPGYGGATFGISFLSDLEVYLFLTAAQGDQRNNIVQAPKITTFNGAPGFINNSSNRYYIAALTPVVGFGAVAFTPTPAPLQDGVTLFVTPVVSADRRYVRMTLTPNFQVVTGLSSFPVPAAVGGGGLGGGATSITGQIQLPETTTTVLSTTVTVPDGGTVLLGGVKRLREERREFGVPLLSKAPMINRLFRNIGIGRRTESLMLMVTPRIIILEEEEERLGIPPQTQ